MAISSLGVGSGLALEELVTQLIQAERRPKLESLQERQNEVNVSLSGYSKLKSELSKVLDSLETLRSPRDMNARAAIINGVSPSSSNGDEDEASTTPANQYLSATASSNAAAASYEVSVEALAQGSKAKSAAFTGADQVITSTAGSLTLATANGDSSFSINVDAGATLSDIAAAINDSNENYGVSASIINTGGANPETRLVLSSSVTGAENELVVTNDNAELDAVSTVASGTGTAGLTIAAEDKASDARLNIDGIDVYSSSNTFTNAIDGVEINAKSLSSGNPQTLEIATDKEGIKNNVKGFVEAYNKFVDTSNKLTNVNVEGSSGALVGDSMVRGLMSGLNNIIGGAVASGESGFKTLYSLGLSFDAEGKLEFGEEGEAKLDEALSNDFNAVSKLFSNDDGVAVQLDSYIKQYTQLGGLFDSKEDVFESQKENLTQERERFDRYMENYEKNLRAEYQALDSMIGQMNQTMSALQGQLANLPGFGGS